ncbi:MAG: FAD-dependent oxidoreductase [Coriobacteriales bacterium]|nr:FAD-dependent oxidoreductase [Coriobacteriales bacterium]
MSMDLTRRSFAKAGVLGTAAGALLAQGATVAAFAEEAAMSASNPEGMRVPSTCNLEREWYKPVEGIVAFEEELVTEFAETVECDMVVVGGGISGCCAAYSGHSNGLNVVLLEKGEKFAGRGAQIGCINSELQINNPDAAKLDAEALVNDGVQSGDHRVNRKIWERYANFSGQAVDWVRGVVGDEAGDWMADTSPISINDGVITWPSVVNCTMMAARIAPVVGQRLIDEGVDVRFNTPAVQLIKEDSRVIGVVAKDPDGQYIKVLAANGVVLATGGYEANWKMLCENVKPRDLIVAQWRNETTTNTGDGILMARAIGAQMDDYPHAMMNDPGTMVATHNWCSSLILGPMRVNEFGKRFINEACSMELVTNAIANQPGAHDWVIYAGDVFATLDEVFKKRNFPFSARGDADEIMTNAACANTLEELANIIGVPEEAFVATVEAYNKAYDEGYDPEWGTSASVLLPLKEPPFYAVEEMNCTMCTASGLTIDQYSRVLDTGYQPIEGLYAIGNCSGSMFEGYYPHHIQAVSHGRCITFGYLVGRRLAGIED